MTERYVQEALTEASNVYNDVVGVHGVGMTALLNAHLNLYDRLNALKWWGRFHPEIEEMVSILGHAIENKNLYIQNESAMYPGILLTYAEGAGHIGMIHQPLLIASAAISSVTCLSLQEHFKTIGHLRVIK